MSVSVIFFFFLSYAFTGGVCMKRILIIIAAIIFICLFIPLTIVLIMGQSVDNSKPFPAPETARTVKVFNHISGTVEEMDINHYLTGVVAAEMPVDFEIEALKAQSVAARTYMTSHLYDFDSGNIDDAHTNAAICTDSTHCQAYVNEKDFKAKRENADEKWDKIKTAVQSTSDEIITYKNKPISAVFFSTSSGKTENAEDVWGREIPYLKSVKSKGDELSPRYTSEKNLSVEEFYKTISQKYPDADISKEPFANEVHSESGGIKSIEVYGISISGTELRSLFELQSTNATLSLKDNTIKISVKGFGHNVGMSQYGANYLASEGKDYKDILKAYYRGIKIKKLSDN